MTLYLVILFLLGAPAFSADSFTIINPKEEKVTVPANFTDVFSGIGIASGTVIDDQVVSYKTAATAAKTVLIRNYARSVTAKITMNKGNWIVSGGNFASASIVEYHKISDYLCLSKANYQVKLKVNRTGLMVYSFSIKANREYDLGDYQGLMQYKTDVISGIDGMVIRYLKSKFRFNRFMEFNYYNIFIQSITGKEVKVVFKYSIKSYK